MSTKFEERNIFIDINEKIIRECKTKEEIYKNVPIEGHRNMEEIISIPSSVMAGAGMFVGAAMIGSNIFNKINSKSKNLSNISTDNGGWGKILASKGLDELINSIKFNSFSIQHYLNNIKEYKNLTRREMARKSNFKEKYLESILVISDNSSKRKPSRDCILGLSFAFDLNLIESTYLLKASGYNELYLRNRRDLIIAKCLLDKMNVRETNIILEKYNEKVVGNRSDEELDLDDLKNISKAKR